MPLSLLMMVATGLDSYGRRQTLSRSSKSNRHCDTSQAQSSMRALVLLNFATHKGDSEHSSLQQTIISSNQSHLGTTCFGLGVGFCRQPLRASQCESRLGFGQSTCFDSHAQRREDFAARFGLAAFLVASIVFDGAMGPAGIVFWIALSILLPIRTLN